NWPPRRYSTIAGFVEPGESLEDAVEREVAEETGVTVTGVRYDSSQPWPFPSSLMIGFQASAAAGSRVRVSGELEDARWFTRAQLGAPSRGELIPRYLNAPALAASAQQFFAALEGQAQRYSGFNLLLTDRDSLWYGSNRASPFARPLSAGIYGLSNELLDTPW